MEILAVLEVVEGLEDKLAALYRSFSGTFSDDEEARGLFSIMSVEEENHRSLVQYEWRVISKNLRGMKKVDLNVNMVVKTTHEIERVLKTNKQLSLDEALSFALRLEASASEHYNAFLLGQVDEGYSKLFKKLTAANDAHYKRLNNFAKARRLACNGSITC